MSRLIRNYQAGTHVVLSDSVRAKGGSDYFNSRAAEEQARTEALAQAVESRRLAVEELQQARQQAEQLLQETQAQIETVRAEAHAEGYEAGYRQGIADGNAAADEATGEMVGRIRALLDEVSTARQTLLNSAEDEVATLAMAIAERVIGQLAQTERQTILHAAQSALDELSITGPFRMRVHPDDEPVLRAHWEAHPPLDGDMAWTLRADESVSRGGCLLQCGPTTVDARLSTQIKAIVHGLSLPDYNPDDAA